MRTIYRPIYIEKCILILKQVVFTARVVLIASGLYSGILLYNTKMFLFFQYIIYYLFWLTWMEYVFLYI